MQMSSDRGLIRSMLKVNSKLRAGMDIRHIFDARMGVTRGSNLPPEEPWLRAVAALELEPGQVRCHLNVDTLIAAPTLKSALQCS